MPKNDGSRAKVVRLTTLSALRTHLGVTQEELARRMKTRQSQVSHFELRGDRRISTLKRYAAALGGKLKLSVQIGGRLYAVPLE